MGEYHYLHRVDADSVPSGYEFRFIPRSPEKNLWLIKMDLSQLDQILVKLVVNAGILSLDIDRRKLRKGFMVS